MWMMKFRIMKKMKLYAVQVKANRKGLDPAQPDGLWDQNKKQHPAFQV